MRMADLTNRTFVCSNFLAAIWARVSCAQPWQYKIFMKPVRASFPLDDTIVDLKVASKNGAYIGARLDGRALRPVRLRRATREKEEKVDVALETMASAMVASAAEGVEVVWWSKCEEEEEGEEEEYEEESVDDEEFEPRPEFDLGGT